MADVVLFGVSTGLSEKERERLLDDVAAIKSVVGAESLEPGQKNTELARHYIATVDGSATPQEVVKQISRLPGIDYASIPAERGFTP